VIFSILKRKGADTEKHGVGTFLGFTLPNSLDMIKIENAFTGYRGRAYVQKKASQRNKQRITGIDRGIFSDWLRQQ
jgi:hypothetical protein